MFIVYILFSFQHEKTYVGFTSNLIQRFKSHNELGAKGYTKKYRPWVVMHLEYFIDKSAAMKREKYFKSGVGREVIKNTLIPKLKNIW